MKAKTMIGIIDDQTPEFKVMVELLNLNGHIFEEAQEDEKYICVLIPHKSYSVIEVAKMHVENEKHIIIVDEIIPLKEVFEHLAGIDDKRYLEDKLMEVPVNDCADKLLDRIRRLFILRKFPLIRKWYWPDFANACAIITHDIDTMNNPPSGSASQSLKYGYTRKVKKEPFSDNMDNIFEIEKAENVQSTFFFFSNYGKFQEHFKDNFCNMKDKFPGELGLHGSSHSFQSHHMLAKEKDELEKLFGIKINGTRQHGLNFRIPHTWRYQEEAGFDYDMSHYYNDKFGFRAGICHPYHPFDALKKERFNILELPTTFMDWTALNMNIDHDNIMKNITNLSDIIEKENGIFTLNFHNMYINEDTYPDITKAFSDSIALLKQKKFWITTGKECAEWWRKRENSNIVIKVAQNKMAIYSGEKLPVIIEYPDKKIVKKIIDAKGIKMEC